MESTKICIYKVLTEKDGSYFYKNNHVPQGFNTENYDEFENLIGYAGYIGAYPPKVNEETFNQYYIMGACKENGGTTMKIQNIEFSNGIYKFHYSIKHISSSATFGDMQMAYVDKKEYKEIEFYENGKLIQTLKRGERPPEILM